MSKHYPRRLSRKTIQRLIDLGQISFDPNSNYAIWFGELFHFSRGQRLCWRVLWDNFLRGNVPIPQARVIMACANAAHKEYTSPYLSDLFGKHPAWKKVIVGDGRGNYWLYVPDTGDDDDEGIALMAA